MDVIIKNHLVILYLNPVDYGKLPIIHTDWGIGLNYKYRQVRKMSLIKW